MDRDDLPAPAMLPRDPEHHMEAICRPRWFSDEYAVTIKPKLINMDLEAVPGTYQRRDIGLQR